MNQLKFKGKWALVTGSTRGIGKEIALELARQGCSVIINDSGRSKDDAESMMKEIQQLKAEGVYLTADVSNFQSCMALAEQIRQKCGKLDIVINNAGITKDRTLKKMTEQEWNEVIHVNLDSMFNVTHNILDLIPDNGRIINISSVVAFSGNFGQSNYAATKAGIIGFTKSLAKELGKRKITVNAVAPGFIRTPMTDNVPVEMLDGILNLIPLKELGMPEDVAHAAAFLASPEAKYITGAVLRIDGGLGF
ncbi:3-oxoacyl-[acyl-carrier-protein] reductase [Candidatus Woesearchaeota archaeon]|nr:3-oxoacyl-[acyl-carrier-protein] reductase [Candidatus Woesearchaeota archaeon]